MNRAASGGYCSIAVGIPLSDTKSALVVLDGLVDATDLLRWDDASLAKHGVEAVSSRLDRTDRRDGDTSWELFPRLRNSDGSMPTLLAVELALLDEDGIEYATWANAIHPGNGPKLVGLATTRVAVMTSRHETDRIVEAVAKVRPGAPHSSRSPADIPLSYDPVALASAGHRLQASRSLCRTSEYGAEIELFVAVRSEMVEGSVQAALIHVIDDDGLPIATGCIDLDPDPAALGSVFGSITLPVQAIPARVALMIPARHTLSRLDRIWGTKELEEFLES